VPFTYGIAGPAGILIGTNIGAGQGGRALRTAWITLLLSALAAEAIGLAAATWPAAWIGLFSGDPAVLAVGTTYLRTVGPFVGFFGIGYALYCAGQGTGRMGWPVAGAVTRAAIAVVGGAGAIRFGASLDHIFMAVSLGMMSFGLFSLPGLFQRSAYTGGCRKPSRTRGSAPSFPATSSIEAPCTIMEAPPAPPRSQTCRIRPSV
jgi:Na+-driven multidrug efflux pump